MWKEEKKLIIHTALRTCDLRIINNENKMTAKSTTKFICKWKKREGRFAISQINTGENFFDFKK